MMNTDLLRKFIQKTLTENVLIKSINDLNFADEVKARGGSVFQVGGFIRDQFLGKDSKDLDILIQGLSYDELEKILIKYGKTDLVGKSFGVIKFKPIGSNEEIDISIPRKEKKVGTGHKGFETYSDKNMTIEDDLGRRDITINAIAKSVDGKIYDPFGGINDLKNKIIRAISKESFSDDPLRMLRAVQFATRFGFTIEPETERMIKENASLIKEISPERVLIEFDKMIKKGDVAQGIELLVNLKLFKEIFGFNFLGNYKSFSKVKDMADFFYLCYSDQSGKPSIDFKSKFMGDIETTKQLEALEMLQLIKEVEPDDRIVVSKMLNKSSNISKSGVINNYIRRILSEFESGKYPAKITDLEINGNDLMAMGINGKEIGLTLGEIFSSILRDKLENNKEDIVNFIQQKSNEEMINEEQDNGGGKVTKLSIFDMDGTLLDSPTPENGKQKYKEVTGKEYPYEEGWWGKLESFVPFDIKSNPGIVDFYNEAKKSPSTKCVLMTNRIPKFESAVKEKLANNNLHFDEYSFKSGRDEKPARIKKFLEKYPDVTEVDVFDDQQDQLVPLEEFKRIMEIENPHFKINVYDAKKYTSLK